MTDQIKEKTIEVSVVMPCLNEEHTIGICIDKAMRVFQQRGLRGEVVVADNGSTDNSVDIALAKGARVVIEPERGYGSAYRKGINHARGEFIIMGDSDNTYDFSTINDFVTLLSEGYDFVIGTRLKGKMMKGSMPALHRYIGNPFLSGMLRFLFRARISDAHCGMRAFTRQAYQKMRLVTTGMEFASEMVINAVRARLKIKEIPITYHLREGKSKLRTFQDGWRHMRFMLLYSPNRLFLIPGLSFFFIGLALMVGLLLGPVTINGRAFDIHCMLMGGLFNIIGVQVTVFGLLGKAYFYVEKFQERNRFIEYCYRKLTFNRVLFFGVVYLVIGLAFVLSVVYEWARNDFGPLDAPRMLFFGSVVTINAVQVIITSFLFSMIAITHRKSNGRMIQERAYREVIDPPTEKTKSSNAVQKTLK
jgi:glycosyltransferase involved in cell wall biosynthesis